MVNLKAYSQPYELRMVNFLPYEFSNWISLLIHCKWRDVTHRRAVDQTLSSGAEQTGVLSWCHHYFSSSKAWMCLTSGHLHMERLRPRLPPYVWDVTCHLPPTHSPRSLHTQIPTIANRSVASHCQQDGQYPDLQMPRTHGSATFSASSPSPGLQGRHTQLQDSPTGPGAPWAPPQWCVLISSVWHTCSDCPSAIVCNNSSITLGKMPAFHFPGEKGFAHKAPSSFLGHVFLNV